MLKTRRGLYAALILWLPTLAKGNPASWEPILADYCFDCHDSASAKAGIDLESALDDPLGERSDLWEKVLRQVQGRVMPPAGKDRPSDSEYQDFSASMISALDAQAAAQPHPGRTETLRRLNRTEYENVIRDLLGIEIDAQTLLPPDQSSHGFDNVTVGDLSPALLDRYISAAQKVTRQALGRTGSSPDGRTIRVPPDITQEGHVEGLPLGTRGGVLVKHSFPKDGDYEIRIHLTRDRDEKVEGIRAPHELQVLVDDEMVSTFEVRPPKNPRDHTKVDAHLSDRIAVKAGIRRFGVTFVEPVPDLIETLRQPYESAFNTHRHPRRSPAIFQVSITGPFNPGDVGNTQSRRHILGTVTHDQAGAKVALKRFIRSAFRGNQDDADLERTLAFYRNSSNGSDFEAGMEAALSAVLVSPKFLFRVEKDPNESAPNTAYRLTSSEIASRLSFFLWSSLPDPPLLDAAAANELKHDAGIITQARRMLADNRARSLAQNFAGQWLYLRNLDSITPDGRLYPDFDDNLRQAMKRETELLFETVIHEDRSVLSLLQSDFTFLNERLAKHYGIPHVYGERYRRVPLDESNRRGGLLRHASVLTVTSYATRTSPVLRGHWVLENLLGTPPPPPPPDVPTLEDNSVDSKLPVRARLAAHRENPACASCHDVMDPIGFAFEHFDAIGQWRSHEDETPVDATGQLPDGTPFDGMAGLEAGLLKRPDLFVRTLTEKLLTFALGRGIETTDAPAVREIVRSAKLDDYRFSAIIEAIVTSQPFTMRMTDS